MPLTALPSCYWEHPGKVRSISLVSSSTAIHILGESIAINKAIQKRQVQARQREHSQILSELKARRLDLSVYTEKNNNKKNWWWRIAG